MTSTHLKRKNAVYHYHGSTILHSGVRNYQKRVYCAVTEESVIFSLYNSLRCEKYVFMGYISKKSMVLPQSSKMSLEVKLVN